MGKRLAILKKLMVFVALILPLVAIPPNDIRASEPLLIFAKDKKANVKVVIADEAAIYEQTAADELAEYLFKVTGAKFEIIVESMITEEENKIFVGSTDFAERKGIIVNELDEEEWIIKTIRNSMILSGGHTRGTLYAVYHFLEDIIGVKWWNPFEEYIPEIPYLYICAPLALQQKPVFSYRDIHTLYVPDRGRFATRNRLNRNGDAAISIEYGGYVFYGPPYQVHTLNLYISPAKYFKDHPEWFALVGGERTDKGQLCLTNEELKVFFLSKLKENIRMTKEKADSMGVPAPFIFSVSASDTYGMCECPDCRALVEAECSEAAPYLSFANYCADNIKDNYPYVYIDTLAYQFTQKLPKSIRPRDNVVIRLCNTKGNRLKTITDPENEEFRGHVLEWATASKNLVVWDYAVTYDRYKDLPYPNLCTYPNYLQFYERNNLNGLFIEFEYPITADMRDLKVWVIMKLLEDPYQDYDVLIRTFTNGFYGAAGKYICEYLLELEKTSKVHNAFVSWGAKSLDEFEYLDLNFILKATKIFDMAEKAVEDDPTLLKRIRHARLSLDYSIMVLWHRLQKEWVDLGKDLANFPIDSQSLIERYRNTCYVEADFRVKQYGTAEKEKLDADKRISIFISSLPRNIENIPEKFRELPLDSIIVYEASQTYNWFNRVKLIRDNEAESGLANFYEIKDADLDREKMPMKWGIYDVKTKKTTRFPYISESDVPGSGFNWYKSGNYNIGSDHYLYFFDGWILQLYFEKLPSLPHDQEYEVWARIKFEGPAYPHGKASDKNAIYVERVVLVKR